MEEDCVSNCRKLIGSWYVEVTICVFSNSYFRITYMTSGRVWLWGTKLERCNSMISLWCITEGDIYEPCSSTCWAKYNDLHNSVSISIGKHLIWAGSMSSTQRCCRYSKFTCITSITTTHSVSTICKPNPLYAITRILNLSGRVELLLNASHTHKSC